MCKYCGFCYSWGSVPSYSGAVVSMHFYNLKNSVHSMKKLLLLIKN